jgi:type VI secretion system protein ImpK
MRLIDCFAPSFAYTLDMIADSEKGETIEFATVQSHIISQIDSLKARAFDGGYSEKQYQIALYAAIALIDEKLVSANWHGRKEWVKSLLQKRYFDTSNAGIEFFNKLDQLNPFNPAERDIREVYFYCMSIGFSGKFYGEGAQSALDIIKHDNYQLLNDDEAISSESLFPSAFARKTVVGKVKVAKNFSSLLYGGPILVLVICFFMFKKQILDLASFLVISV